jgi:hypothetical protein
MGQSKWVILATSHAVVDKALTPKWSVASYGHSGSADCIVYSSRLTAEINLAVYDRSVPKTREQDQNVLSKPERKSSHVPLEPQERCVQQEHLSYSLCREPELTN